jgi:Protein of unknown function (DUF1566)/Divergent InlB B-repeat domain
MVMAFMVETYRGDTPGSNRTKVAVALEPPQILAISFPSHHRTFTLPTARMRILRSTVMSLVVGSLLLGGCSGGGTSDPVPTTRTVTVAATGTGAGTIVSAPAGINCGTTCSATLSATTAITLTATPNATSTFGGWSGACSGTVPACTIPAATSNASATAQFNPITFALTVATAGSGLGTVTSTPAGISCGSDCTETYTSGTVVTLAAAPSATSTFSGWSGAGCSGTGTCVVTMSQAQSVTATFVIPTRTLTTVLAGSGSGTVSSAPAGITCGADCTEDFNVATVVTLTATPAASSTFAGWTGACSGTGTCVLQMNAAATATATFTLKTYTLTVTRAGTGTGSVSSSPAGITCGADCTEVYNHGTTITLTAAPDGNSVFSGWSGGCTGTGTCIVSLTAATTVTATFAQFQGLWPDSFTRTCSDGAAILACPGGPLGQDGHYTINVPVYEVVGGHVRDAVTGLIWERAPPTTDITHAAATTYCDDLTLSGFTDWRLPSFLELVSLADFGRVGPPFATTAFLGIPQNSFYWSSTDQAGDPTSSRVINTNYPVSRQRNKTLTSGSLVRCVRGTAFAGGLNSTGITVIDGRTGLIWQNGIAPTDLTLVDALAYCEALVLDGLTNWRLPNGKELFTLVDETRTNPSISPLFSSRPATRFWSSSYVANTANNAYVVRFDNGQTDDIGTVVTQTRATRCVTGG